MVHGVSRGAWGICTVHGHRQSPAPNPTPQPFLDTQGRRGPVWQIWGRMGPVWRVDGLEGGRQGPGALLGALEQDPQLAGRQR